MNAENENIDPMSIEAVQQGVLTTISYIFERYKMLNCLLGYIIENDYDGRFIMSLDEWDKNIMEHNFTTGWIVNNEDENIHIVGKENG